MGWFNVRPDAIEIFPGPESYFRDEPGVIKFSARPDLPDHFAPGQYRPPASFSSSRSSITNLYDRNREKRRLVHYDDIPTVLIDAIISAEDKRFFQHAGFDPFRIVKAVYVDLKQGRKAEGASTLSMQLARSFWLDNDKSWGRKVAEMMITLELEQKLIEETDLRVLLQPDRPRPARQLRHSRIRRSRAGLLRQRHPAAHRFPKPPSLAGLVQRPSYYNPYRHPDRVRERRNVVLSLMRQNGYISEREYALACDAPLQLVIHRVGIRRSAVLRRPGQRRPPVAFQDKDFQASSYRIYTTLDLDLQRAANEAVRVGMQNVDDLLKKQRRHKNVPFPEAQVRSSRSIRTPARSRRSSAGGTTAPAS